MAATSDMSFLDVDTVTVPGQLYSLISVVPDKDNTIFGLKIRGTFGTKEEASHHAEKLSASEGNRLNIYLVDNYKWLQIPPPDVNSISESVYAEKKLNAIMQDYEQNRVGAKALYEQRKLDVMRDGIDSHLAPDEKIEKVEGDAGPSALNVDSMFAEDDPLTVRQQQQQQETS